MSPLGPHLSGGASLARFSPLQASRAASPASAAVLHTSAIPQQSSRLPSPVPPLVLLPSSSPLVSPAMDPLGNLQFTTSGALIELVDSASTCPPFCPAARKLADPPRLLARREGPRAPARRPETDRRVALVRPVRCVPAPLLPASPERAPLTLIPEPSPPPPSLAPDRRPRQPASANLVLTQTIERLYHPATKAYAQTERGVFLVRGENVVLLGEVVRPLSLSRSRVEPRRLDMGCQTSLRWHTTSR